MNYYRPLAIVVSTSLLLGCESSKLLPGAGYVGVPQLELQRAVDTRFGQWSRSWSIDRYIPSSTKIQESQAQGPGTYYAKGTFQFVRFGSRYEIPFAATLDSKNNDLTVRNLCYRDNTSGMNDCLAAGAAGSGSSQLLGAILLLGVVAALAGSDASSPQSTRPPQPTTIYREQQCTVETTCEPSYYDLYGGWNRGECRTEKRCY
ncbi:hypothetical protein [Pseudorhodoferax sp.]|uniref:hypothetical protein n=1 Tax=Pseudorhodoferax sp. TaxID=1993553 RepID=UPI0039E4E9DC